MGERRANPSTERSNSTAQLRTGLIILSICWSGGASLPRGDESSGQEYLLAGQTIRWKVHPFADSLFLVTPFACSFEQLTLYGRRTPELYLRLNERRFKWIECDPGILFCRPAFGAWRRELAQQPKHGYLGLRFDPR
ncbi:hypothetical protein BDV93DRAFT_514641 [Ceratobasidium sp. AG-I]|nr:hypothetical protein BDV93DRAFT_514641 [Ceratobasidium sp. AG-I]